MVEPSLVRLVGDRMTVSITDVDNRVAMTRTVSDVGRMCTNVHPTFLSPYTRNHGRPGRSLKGTVLVLLEPFPCCPLAHPQLFREIPATRSLTEAPISGSLTDFPIAVVHYRCPQATLPTVPRPHLLAALVHTSGGHSLVFAVTVNYLVTIYDCPASSRSITKHFPSCGLGCTLDGDARNIGSLMLVIILGRILLSRPLCPVPDFALYNPPIEAVRPRRWIQTFG